LDRYIHFLCTSNFSLVSILHEYDRFFEKLAFIPSRHFDMIYNVSRETRRILKQNNPHH